MPADARQPRPAAAPTGLPLPGFSAPTAAALARSRLREEALHDDATVSAWVRHQRGLPRLQARPVRLDRLQQWQIDPRSGNIAHESGRFFSLTGLHVRHRTGGREYEWDQPIIDQPEVGILGILAKPIAGTLHFCLQAKEEPGNIGGNQLSPTVQATFSNYSGVHGGTLPPLLEHFLAPPAERVLFARLQSEDGSRFLYKSNRNMIVLLPAEAEVPLPDGFIWLTLRQIAGLLRQSNLVHATTRSILATLVGCARAPVPAGLAATGTEAAPAPLPDPAALTATLQWFDDRKAHHHFLVRRIGINDLADWGLDSDGFLSHREERFFRVIGLEISGADREVAAWRQPILCNPENGVIGLLLRERDGRRQVLMQAKAEVGNRNLVQLGPTVQFTPGNYSHNPRLAKPFLFDAFNDPGQLPVFWENLQSEEGARFYRETHHHRILRLPDGVALDLPDDYRWLDEDEVRFFLHFGDLVNSCARSIFACLL